MVRSQQQPPRPRRRPRPPRRPAQTTSATTKAARRCPQPIPHRCLIIVIISPPSLIFLFFCFLPRLFMMCLTDSLSPPSRSPLAPVCSTREQTSPRRLITHTNQPTIITGRRVPADYSHTPMLLFLFPHHPSSPDR
mmetsp:Transcript_11268/g.28660  ORF Transcript_11268/g.28660 Transcript_11268/m.28660 type:complete len:136 (+) Transcript_11268:520-927(+)